MFSVINTKDKWTNAVNFYSSADFYHTYTYHKLAEYNNEGTPILFQYKPNENVSIAMPFLLRQDTIFDMEIFDLSSVYGYPGPLVEGIPDEKHYKNWYSYLTNWMLDNKILSAFSRLHPVFSNEDSLKGIGELHTIGKTVLCETNISEVDQYKRYKSTLRYDLKKIKQNGIEVIKDSEIDIPGFLNIYNETMERLSARDFYRFTDQYLTSLTKSTEYSSRIYRAVYKGGTIACCLIIFYKNIAQYHLSGSNSLGRKFSATKLLIDRARHDASISGIDLFHLGGGLGGENDNLFLFKSRFSPIHKICKVFKAIPNKKNYLKAVNACRKTIPKNKHLDLGNYFPEYRVYTE